MYIEKVARMTFAPSLSHFGAKPISGWLAITATGLVCMHSRLVTGHIFAMLMARINDRESVNWVAELWNVFCCLAMRRTLVNLKKNWAKLLHVFSITVTEMR